MVAFTVGELFDSFSDLQSKLNDYSEEHFCHFYIKDSKKLTNDETVNPNLIYKHIVYCCIYGGQKPRFRGSGSRSVTSIRHGCTSSLYLRVTKDRTHLQVRSFNEAHNHEISEELFRSAAQDKKLPYELRLEVEEMLLLGADKDRICEYVRHVSKKSLDKKNLFNMYETAIKQQREISRERAVMLIQKAYSVATEEEADQILSQLLETTRTPRRSRKQESESDNVQYIVNDSEETQVDGGVPEETLQRLMGSLGNQDGDLVIIQGDQEYAVYNADEAMEAEYLEDDEGKEGEVVIKQEHKKNETEVLGNDSPRYITLKDISRTIPNKKRGMTATPKGGRKYVSEESNVIYEPSPKTRIITRDFTEADEIVTEVDPLVAELRDMKMAKLRAEQQKLQVETELLALQRNKLSRELTKLEIEKNKLHLEIDVMKQSKQVLTQKSTWLASDMKNKELKNEKLKLEIAKLKLETNGKFEVI